MSHRNKVIKYIKLVVVSLTAASIVYGTYVVIGCFILLDRQPKFVLPDGSITYSQGFMVQGLIAGGILAALVIAELLFVYFMYLRKRFDRKAIEVCESSGIAL